MKNTQKGYIVPALLGIIALLIIAFITYIYNDKRGAPASSNSKESETNQPTETATTLAENTQAPTNTGGVLNATTSAAAMPNIAIVVPSSVPLLSGFKINGTQLDAVSDNSSGWSSRSHIFVKITDSSGKTGILWEGGSQGGKASIPNQIEVGAIPKTICTVSEVGTGPCSADKKMEVAPGKYTLNVSVDGRGVSNTLPLTIIGAAQ